MADNPETKPARLHCPNCGEMMGIDLADPRNVYRCAHCVSKWFIVRARKPIHRSGMAKEWDA